MRIIIDVKTEANKEVIEKFDEGRYTVWVKAPRKKGKANAAVLKLLERHFGAKAWIVKGFTSTKKIVEIE